MSTGAEEASKIKSINTTVIVLIDGTVSGKQAVIVPNLKVTFEGVESSLQSDLRL